MYAQLCKRLSDEAPNFELPKPIVDGQKPQSTFKILLLNKCKAEFENRSKANEAFENQDDLGPEDEERRQMAKRKMLGNIKFIGELGKLEIVSESILHLCIQQLLSEKRRRRPRGDTAEDIECLCQIMRTCGRILDSDKGRKLMDQYFNRMSSLAESSELPLRIRFMLRDVIELRRDNWVPRKATSTEGPMPIGQINNDNDDTSSRSGGSSIYHRREDRLGNDFLRKMGRPGIDMDIVGSLPLSTPSFGMSSPFSHPHPNGFTTPPTSNTGYIVHGHNHNVHGGNIGIGHGRGHGHGHGHGHVHSAIGGSINSNSSNNSSHTVHGGGGGGSGGSGGGGIGIGVVGGSGGIGNNINSGNMNSNTGRHNQRNQTASYFPNQNHRHQSNNFNNNKHNQQHNHNQHNISSSNYNNNISNNNKQEQLRFNKNKMLIGHPEEVSLRPSTTSMIFKQANIKPLNTDNITFPGSRTHNDHTTSSLLRNATLSNKTSSGTGVIGNNIIASGVGGGGGGGCGGVSGGSSLGGVGGSSVVVGSNISPPLLPIKEQTPVIVIKQGPLDKRDKARDRKDKGPTRDEIVKKVNNMMDDISMDINIKDAVTMFKDLKIPERFIRHSIYTIYSNTLERSDTERDFAVKLVAELKKDNIITSQQMMEGWKELVSSIVEKESTVPCVASYIASITAKAIVNNLLLLQDLASITENGQYHPLFLLTLQQLHKTQGKASLTQIFNDSKINLMSQLPEAEKTKARLGEILEDRELTFLYPLLRIQGEMSRQLESDPSPSAFYKWIKDKLDPAHHSDSGFINALMTVLIQYITKETTLAPDIDTTVVPEKSLQDKERALLAKYTRVLESFLVTIDAQITAVHSLQVFCYSHNFPKGMLLRWFVALYELSIIDEEAFIKWREGITDAYPGKGRALFQVNTWLTWLEEAPSEEEEEEDEGDN